MVTQSEESLSVSMLGGIQSLENTALVVVDVQNDFLPDGNLAVPEGDEVIEIINKITRSIKFGGGIYFSKDWHPWDHISFASNHNGKNVFSKTILNDGTEQMLWPDHCVQDTHGAEINCNVNIPEGAVVIHKGYTSDSDSYSAFGNGICLGRGTSLGAELRERNVKTVIIVGLAYDVCVLNTAVDAKKEGFDAIVLKDACVSSLFLSDVFPSFRNFPALKN